MEHRQTLVSRLHNRRKIVNTQEKIDLINDKINQIGIHINLLQNNIDNEFENKEGLPTFMEIMQDFMLKRNALIQERDMLDNQ